MHDKDRFILENLSKLASVPADPAGCEQAMQRATEQILAEETQPPAGASIFSFDRSRKLARSLKWLVPLAVAAAVVLAVGLWPASRGHKSAENLYAFSDMPSLLRGAAVLHENSIVYLPVLAPPNQERRSLSVDEWVDAQAGRWCERTQLLGRLPGTPDPTAEDLQGSWGDCVCDGEYIIWVDHARKKVRYEKPTPVLRRYRARSRRDRLVGWLSPERIQQSRLIGREMVDGQPCELWEEHIAEVPEVEGPEFRILYWFSPQLGAVTKSRWFLRGPASAGAWLCYRDGVKLERNVEAPPGTYVLTEPPAGYRLINTKATAEQLWLGDGMEGAEVGSLHVTAYIQFEFPGHVLLFAWSGRDNQDSNSQAPLFADLVPGGPLPKLPLQVSKLRPLPNRGDMAWIGYHLAHTQKAGLFYEWSLYVPNQAPPVTGLLKYGVCLSPEQKDLKRPPSWSCGSSITIDSRADFDEFVLAAMSELSDTGAAPSGVTYDGVVQLSEQIRTSLPSK